MVDFKTYEELKPLALKIDALYNPKDESHKDWAKRFNRVGEIIRILNKKQIKHD